MADYFKEWRGDNKDRLRARYLLGKYGLTPEGYAEMLEAQGGTCGLCDMVCPTGNNLAVDHDHGTGFNRGLLCISCNTGLGSLKDSPDILVKALNYLSKHGKALSTEELAQKLNLKP
jgi:hypothetical protein